MTWVKLDDGMGEHRKTVRALRAGGLGAFGLNVLGVLHCAKYLTDGFVEDEFVDETFAVARTKPAERRRILESLTERDLWHRDDVRGGWMVHGYLDYNPSRVQVEEQRRKDAERKAKGRAAQSAKSPASVQPDSVRTDNGIRAESDGPVPSRPDPAPIPPNPPGGELPVPVLPSSGRQRDVQEFNAEVRAYAAERFPHGDPAAVVPAIVSGLKKHMTTHAEIEAYLVQWELVPAARPALREVS